MKRMAIGALLAVLTGSAAAQKAKKKVPDRDISADVAAVYGADVEAAGKAVEQLGAIGTPAAHEALLDALAMGLTPSVAMLALQALALHPAPPDVLAIRRYAGHHDPATRSTAVASLALYPDPKARAAIVAGLHDPAGMVRTAAARAAAKGRVRDATESLIALLARGEESAAKALAQLADTELARTLADQLGKVPEATLALALGQILLRADFGPDQSKVEVVRAIAKIQDAAAVTALTDYIDSPVSQGKASRAEAEGIVDARLGGK